ncbi:MAG TPA: hypothetical protein VLN48_19045, partial [Bryobacteraceae bacterium]|nr:hypothetical protein [Bryobacteraceae bacterium]
VAGPGAAYAGLDYRRSCHRVSAFIGVDEGVPQGGLDTNKYSPVCRHGDYGSVRFTAARIAAA